MVYAKVKGRETDFCQILIVMDAPLLPVVPRFSLVRWMIAVFPLGLILMGALSFIFYFKKLNAKNEVQNNEHALLLQKEPNEEDLKRHVRTLSETIGERHPGQRENYEAAAAYIKSSLGPMGAGYEVKTQAFKVNDLTCENIEVELPGKQAKDEIILVGAHYDTVAACPGANDNGSGVAALISLAQALTGQVNERTLRLVAFANEENPWFATDHHGALRYAKRSQERKEKIVGMFSLETLGFYSNEKDSQGYPGGMEGQFPSTGNFVALVTNMTSKKLLNQAMAGFQRQSSFPAQGAAFPPFVLDVARSDHFAFWMAGYPAIMVTDTANYRYKEYHTPDDKWDRLNYPEFTKVVLGLRFMLQDLLNPSAVKK